ncbi:hypothetical protein TNCV_1057941 [Trichonephila clavipes]|nr:hypothetical protein TNCV_1057941 [Trichonephila clavipes]
MDSICPHCDIIWAICVITSLASSELLFVPFLTTSAKEGVGCFLISLRAAARSCQTFFVGLFLLGFVLMGFLGHHEKFAGCGPLQLAHLAGALADLVHSDVRWPPEYFKHFGALAQNRE